MRTPRTPFRACLFRFLLLCLEKRRPQVFDCLVIRILVPAPFVRMEWILVYQP